MASPRRGAASGNASRLAHVLVTKYAVEITSYTVTPYPRTQK